MHYAVAAASAFGSAAPAIFETRSTSRQL
jgi:hypothetical protein